MKNEYLGTTILYAEAARRYKEISGYCRILEGRLEKYPQDKIHVVKSNGSVQYYLRQKATDKSGLYLSKKEEKLIKVLLQKKYDYKVYKLLKAEKTCIERLLVKSKDFVDEIRLAYSNNPIEVKKILEPIDISDEDYVTEWMGQAYMGKEISEDCPIYITNKNERVRSKSELNIANMLGKMGIPYKYEYPFLLSSGKIIYPDFTLLRVKDRKQIYWEHRGMMDDRDYAKHAVRRLKQLAREGVIIGNNLIITEETQLSPLGTDEIEIMIKQWFG